MEILPPDPIPRDSGSHVAPPTGGGASRIGLGDGASIARDSDISLPIIPCAGNETGLGAYRLGQRLNLLRWRMELVPLVKAVKAEDVEESFVSLIPPLRKLVADPAGARIERLILEAMADWKTDLSSESFSESAVVTWQSYKWAAEEGPFEDDFDDVTRYGMRTVTEIKKAVCESLGPEVDLIRLVELGELIDQAIRPADCAKHVFRQELNRERWRMKRSSYHRERSAAYGREMVRYKTALRSRPAGRLDDDEDEDNPTPPVPQMPRGRPGLPRPTVFGPSLPSWKDIELCPVWAVRIREYWAILKIGEGLPKALWAVHKRPGTSAVPSLIRRIDAALVLLRYVS